MNILKKCTSFLLSAVMVMGMVAIGIPIATSTAQAAEIGTATDEPMTSVGAGSTGIGNVTINQGTHFTVQNGVNFNTYRFTTNVGNGTAYCVEPIKRSPTQGAASKTFPGSSVSPLTNEDVLKSLYYGYGGPGFTVTKNAFSSGNSGYPSTPKGLMDYYKSRYGLTTNSTDYYYCMTHFATSYIRSGESSYSGALTGNWQTAVKSYSACVKSLNSVSNSMRAYVLDTGSETQKMVFAVYKKRLEFNKVSSNPSFTNNNTAYSLNGAQFIFYTNTDDADAARKEEHSVDRAAHNAVKNAAGNLAYIETDSNGVGRFYNIGTAGNGLTYALVDMNVSTYCTVEFRTPRTNGQRTGYLFSSEYYRFVDSGQTDSNGLPIFRLRSSYKNSNGLPSFKDDPMMVLQMTKCSGDTTITDGNDCYSLAGAEYGIYTSETCDSSSLLGTITTDENGNGSYLSGKGIAAQRLWAKEIKPSPGYLLDTSIHPFTWSGEYNSNGYPIYSFNSVEQPDSDPITVLLQKYDATTGKGTNTEKLANALFQVDFYPQQYANVEEIGDAEPTRSWVFKTDEDGYINFESAYKISGSDFWYQTINNIELPTLPYGTITVKEIEAPEGYQINPEVFIANINGNGEKISWRTTNENVDASVLQFPETQDNGGLEIRKTSSDNKIANIWFRVSAEGYSKDFCTNESGIIINDELSGLDVNKTYTVTELGLKNSDGTYRYPLRYGTPPPPQTVNLEAGKTVTVSFKNATTPVKLKIIKEADDGVVQNVWFSITGNDGTQYPNIVTNQEGIAEINNLPQYDDNDNIILYTVTEIGELQTDGTYAIPYRYNPPSQIKSKTVNLTQALDDDNGTPTKTLLYTNSFRKGKLTINKNTVPSGYNSNGMWLSVTSNDGYSKNVQITGTGSTGNIVLSDLNVHNGNGEPIEYTIKELGYKQPDGTYKFPEHFYQKEPIVTTLIAGENNYENTVTITNKVKMAKLHITKTAEYNDVSNVWFKLTSDSGYSQNASTDANGTVSLSSLPVFNTDGDLITYTLEELGIATDNGYTIPKRYVKPENQVFTFEEYNDESQYNEDGILALDSTGTSTKELAVQNEPKRGSLTIRKTSDDQQISGLYFNVKSGSGANTIDYGTYPTNEEGIITFPNLPVYDVNNNLIVYTVTEMGFMSGNKWYIPEQYETPVPFTTTLTEDETTEYATEITYRNTLKHGKIKIVKSADDGIVADIYFKITNLSTNQEVGIFKTNSNGEILTEDLPVTSNGELISYRIEELGELQSNGTYEIPDRYIHPEPVTVTLKAGGNATAYFSNTSQMGYVALFKMRSDFYGNVLNYPEDSHNPNYEVTRIWPGVSGAHMGLYTDISCKTLVAETVSDEDGFILFGPVPYGSYYINEISPPAGYWKPEHIGSWAVGAQYFSATAEEAKQKARYTIPNAPVSFYVYKFDDEIYIGENDDPYDFEGQGLAGCTITVYDSQNEIVDQWVTDGNSHEVTGREYGKRIYVGETYTIIETNPVNGYSIAEPIHYTVRDEEKETHYSERGGHKYFTYTYKNPNNVIIYNSPTETHITKTDITGADELEGAHLTVTKENGTVIDSWVSDRSEHTIKGLVAGQRYILTETIAPEGYTLSTPITFTVNTDGSPTHVTMQDDYTKVAFYKQDEYGHLLAGVTLAVIDENGRTIDEWETNSTDPHTIIGQLVVGKTYTLREISSPSRYSLADDVVFTVRNNNAVQPITMTNQKTKTYITKTDITGQNEIEGAHLILKDTTGNTVDEWTSESKAHLITGLNKGQKYVLTETIAPNGYAISNSVTFTVPLDGQPTYVTMKDAPTRVRLEKINENGARIAGALLQIIDENDNIVDEWTSSANGGHDITARLAIGKTYRMHEVTAPSQYVLSEDVSFTVKNTGNLQTVQMTDAYTKTYISKTEITGSQEISGAHLSLAVKGGSVVEEWTSTTSPHLVKGLTAGQTYILTETLAPNGYTTSEAIEFTVNTDGQPTHVVMKDSEVKVKFNKVDENGNRVAGVVLKVIDDNNNTVAQWTTDGITDKTLSGQLVVGKTYKLREVSAPNTLVLANDVTFTVQNSNAIQTVKMTNNFTKTYISKKDVTGDDELPGANLTVKNASGTVVDRWTSTTSPHLIKGLSAGQTYTLTEQSSPDGYTIASEINFTVRLDGTPTQVTMRDAPTKVRLIKLNESGSPVSGVVLQVRNLQGNVIEQWTTTDTGTHDIVGKLKVYNQYVLHEVSAPNQFKLANDVSFIVDNTTDIQSVTMSNELKRGNLQITKSSDDSRTENIYFRVNGSDGADYGTKATNSDGVATFTNLPVYDSNQQLITYTVTELGYEADGTFSIPSYYNTPSAQTTTLSYDSTTTVTTTNVVFHNTTKPGKIRIVKTASDNIVSNVWFKITNLTTGEEVGTFSTNASGEILSSNLTAYLNGTQYQYKVEELGFLKADKSGYEYPSRYGNIPAPVTVSLVPNETSIVHFNNTSEKGYAAVTKRDMDNRRVYVAGATFGLYSGNDLIATCVTDTKGRGSFGLVPLGAYTVKEIEAPPGYVLNTTWSATINVTANNNDDSRAAYTTCLDKKTSVTIDKLGENEENMSGCVLKVVDSENNQVEKWTYDGTAKVIRGLIIGQTYQLIEESSVAGYTIAEPISFTVQDENSGEHINDVFMQNTKTETYFSKYAATNDTEIAGARLSVSVKNGETVDEWTSTKEQHLIRGLKQGTTYVLTEILPPPGYTTTSSVEFTINADGSPTHVIMRDSTTKVRIAKVDKNGNRIAGVSLQLFDESGQLVDSWTTTKTYHSYNGKLTVGKTYTLHEVSAPPQYVLADDLTITIQDTENTQTFTMTNLPTETYISKTDITGSTELAGAHLSLSVKNGSLVEEWTSETTPHKIEGLSAGETYVLTETQAPNGFATTEAIEFTVNTDGTPTHVEMADDTTKVEFKKINTSYQLVKDVVLQVLDSNNNVIEEWTTDGKTNHIIEGKLVVGQSYKLHEVSAPNEYRVAGVRKFTVRDTNDIQLVQLANRFKTGSVTLHKQDENGGTIDGSVWQLFDANNIPVGTAQTGPSAYTYTSMNQATTQTTVQGSFSINNLPLGIYYLKEVTPPTNNYFPFEGKAYFTISAESHATLNSTLTVKNNRIVGIQTGGVGDCIFYVFGGFFALLPATFIIFYSKERRKKT